MIVALVYYLRMTDFVVETRRSILSEHYFLSDNSCVPVLFYATLTDESSSIFIYHLYTIPKLPTIEN